MEYATDHERFDPFNFNRYQAEMAGGLPAGLAKVLFILGGAISFSRDNSRYPIGTVSGISVQSLADRCHMALSTVQAHLSEAKRRKLVEAETLRDKAGRTIGVRYYFIGFSRWLLEGRFMSRRTQEEPVQETGGGGSENPDPNKIKDSSNNIIHDGLLNLEFEGPVTYTEIAAQIREAKPLVNGKAADPNKVWADFRDFNRKKGKKWLPLKWLLGFCRVYGRKKFTKADDPKPDFESQENKAIEAIETPVFDLDNPFDQASKQVFERNPASWKSWIKPLTARRDGNVWVVESPTKFHTRYVVEHFEDVFGHFFGRGGVKFV